MSAKDINHFLVVYHINSGHADVAQFGTDYVEALRAYNECEAVYRDEANVEVVLLGSDSLETLRRTHSSYFELSEKHIDQVVGRELAELGLR